MLSKVQYMLFVNQQRCSYSPERGGAAADLHGGRHRHSWLVLEVTSF